MTDSQIQEHIDALREYIQNTLSGSNDLDELRVKKAQLSAVQRTIRQLEKNNVPVPQGINNEKLTLISSIDELEKNSNSGVKIYDELLDIIFHLGLVCNRLPHKDLYRHIREWRKQTTPPQVLRKTVVSYLREMGGSGKERDIVSQIEEKLGNQFTPADLEQPHGKRFKWQTNLRRERKRMIKEGVLTKDSNKSTWTLAK